MNLLPAVSVVIGTRDRKRFLQRAVDSIRAETADLEVELIVVDGGSTDGTLRWLMQQKDVITIVQHNHGIWRGQSVARRPWGYFMNLGFKAASAPIICMLSDDCLVVPGAIVNGMRALETAGGDVGAAAFYWRNWPNEDTYRVGLTFGGRMFVNHGLFGREALSSVGFADDETFEFYHADGDLALRMDAAGFKCIDSSESYIEHFAHANRPSRDGQDDWEAYAQRWGHLGAPPRDWIERRYDDPHQTALRFWGAGTSGGRSPSRLRAFKGGS